MGSWQGLASFATETSLRNVVFEPDVYTALCKGRCQGTGLFKTHSLRGFTRFHRNLRWMQASFCLLWGEGVRREL